MITAAQGACGIGWPRTLIRYGSPRIVVAPIDPTPQSAPTTTSARPVGRRMLAEQPNLHEDSHGFVSLASPSWASEPASPRLPRRSIGSPSNEDGARRAFSLTERRLQP